MSTAYDFWLEPDEDSADERREEQIEERATKLFEARITDPKHVREAAEALFCIGAGDTLEVALAAFFLAFDEAQTDTGMAEAGMALFRTIKPTIEGTIRDDANTDAAHEADVAEREALEMRADYLLMRREMAA